MNLKNILSFNTPKTSSEQLYKNEFKNNWGEAVSYVDQAVKIAINNLMRDGGHTEIAHAKAKQLEAAWKRILQG